MAKKFLTLNIGATTVSLAEYEGGSGSLTLVKYGTSRLAAPLDGGNTETILVPAILDIVREQGIRPGKVALAVSGQLTFQRFAAIPMAGGEEKFEQLVRYEIEQNIPFPIDEMVCDRQVLGDTESGDKSVMIVAAKIDQVEPITAAVEAAGFTPEIVDVAPIALTNAMLAGMGGSGEATVLLDVGAKTTSLVIVEGDKVYNRSIPVAGNTITKEIASALGCTPEEADAYKCENAYVSLGGVTEDEDETRDRVAKICRAVMTRLHAEISRSINFYRSQQGGWVPTKLYLTGGTALLPQIDRFFADNLGIEVEFFNPFAVVGVGPQVDAAALESDGAMIAATAGLALHASGNSRFAINLLPPELIARRADVARIPFVAAGAAGIVLALVAALLAVWHQTDVAQAKCDAVQAEVSQVKKLEQEVRKASEKATAETAKAERFRALMEARSSAVRQFASVRAALGEGMWIERWESGKVTIRGWKDRIAAFVEQDAQRNAGKRRTASEIVAGKLKGNPKVDGESVKIADMTTLGDGAVEQFVVELKFK